MTASTHPLSPPEIVVRALPDDERVWVPQAPGVWVRPLMLNTLNGQWCTSYGCARPACSRATAIRPRCMASS
jgi:hypothetical protein